jgi:2-keto-4-pentenoate hydratase/2-oxohepta-3-ene-1,7-dioic acid hydratase in catechol pathway
MKLATYRVSGGAPRIGLVHDGDRRLFDLKAAAARAGTDAAPFGSMLALIDADEAGLDAARGLFDRRGNEHDLVMEVADVELLAPLPEPRQMRDGMTFPLHIRQGPRGMRRIAAAGNAEALAAIEAEPLPDLAEVYRKVPIYYITNRLIVRGSGATIRWPRYSKVMDYELEFGVVTRRQGVNITAEKARDHIFGYTIFNDFSARDQQMIEMQGWLGPAKGKSFDGANVLGPWIVTPDEIGDPYKLKMQARVNGEVWSEGVSEGMLFSFEEMIAYMSRDETLHPGEFIGSGTVGNGCGLEHGRFLQHGDTIELEVERIGILKNRVERQDA